MDYRKIIKSQKLRFAILRYLSFVPDFLMLKFQYRIQMGRSLHLKNPKFWTEKIQLYKMYYRNPILHQCVDKYNVRQYIESKGLGSILNELYGVYNRVEDIDYNTLPNKFILKSTSGGGGLNVLVCQDKSAFDKGAVQKLLNFDANHAVQTSSVGREWAYVGNTNRIIVEKLLECNDDVSQGLADYKILCFQGEPKIVILDVDRYVDHKRNFYDTAWNNLNITSDHECTSREIPKPKNLEEMLEVARKLSEDFPMVRVDLYNIYGKIVFGELTFYPWSGYVTFHPQEFDVRLGEMFDISIFTPTCIK